MQALLKLCNLKKGCIQYVPLPDRPMGGIVRLYQLIGVPSQFYAIIATAFGPFRGDSTYPCTSG